MQNNQLPSYCSRCCEAVNSQNEKKKALDSFVFSQNAEIIGLCLKKTIYLKLNIYLYTTSHMPKELQKLPVITCAVVCSAQGRGTHLHLCRIQEVWLHADVCPKRAHCRTRVTIVIYLSHIPVPFQSQCCMYLKISLGAIKLVKILIMFCLFLN